jgi:putative hydrolase of HD superfamily
MDHDELHAAARYAYEAGELKLSRRTGWWHAGVRDPESVAEHSWRTAVIGYALAVIEGADAAATAAMCVFHDMVETRIGDIPLIARHYVSHQPHGAIVRDQTLELPAAVRDSLRDLMDAYEAQESLEARLARDADKLECLIQAREYEHQGYGAVQPWIDSNYALLRSAAARGLADAALAITPDTWWRRVAAHRRPTADAGDPRPDPPRP